MALTKRDLQKEKTRGDILDAAYSLYAQEGFQVPTARIASLAGVSHGTIFLHFQTSEELLCKVIERFGEQMNQELHHLSESQDSIHTFLKAHLRIVSKHEALYRRVISGQNDLPKLAWNVVVNMQSIVAWHFSRLLEQQSEISAEPHLLFNTWMGLIHYYILNPRMFAPDGNVLVRHGETLASYFSNFVLN